MTVINLELKQICFPAEILWPCPLKDFVNCSQDPFDINPCMVLMLNIKHTFLFSGNFQEGKYELN